MTKRRAALAERATVPSLCDVFEVTSARLPFRSRFLSRGYRSVRVPSRRIHQIGHGARRAAEYLASPAANLKN
jgi:hypothetical protein